MNVIIIVALIIVAILLTILIILITSKKGSQDTLLGQQLIDLKNQVIELKTKQIEAQTNSFQEQQKSGQAALDALNKQLNEIMTTVNTTLQSSHTTINSQLSSSNQVIGEVQKKLGELEAATKNMQAIGKDISSLQDILRAPKLRGNLGEYLLEELLKEIFPKSNYEMKYNFKNGTQVDAIIRLGDGIVPVDSKFPLESFKRLIQTEDIEQAKVFKKEFIKSVKQRIDEIESKYINQDEGTYDFAIMYIPAENIFYETIINDSLTDKEYEIFNYAIKKHIIPVSPNSFYAYLMALVYGLKGFKIEQQARKIIGELGKVQTNFNKFYGDYILVGKHLSNAASKYQDTTAVAEKLNNKINEITNVEIDLVDQPKLVDISE